jgi:2,5-diketo-D-gluconate reductase B
LRAPWHGAGGLQSIAKGRIRNDRALLRIGDRYRKSAAQVCLRWLVQQGVAAIPRTSKLERLSENIEIFDFELSEEDMREISSMGGAGGRLTDFSLAPKWD